MIQSPKGYPAGGAIAARRIVKFSTTTVVQGAAATDSIVGINGELAAAQGEIADINFVGLALVECGGNVAVGAPVTSDANGKAVTAAPGAGVNNRVIGFMLEAGADGEHRLCLISPCVMQG